MKFPFVVFAASVLCGKPFAFYGNSFAVKTTPPTTANPDEVAQTVRKAVIALIPDASNPLAKGVVGYVEIKQLDKFSPVNITGQINGLPPNSMHGLHFHQNGAIFPNCTATGGHFNPKSTEHGAPTARIHHAGDLGNVLADVNGVINFNLKFDYITLFGGNSIVGRGLVLHEKIDDLGLGVGNLTATSKLTGNSGSRLCCGVVGLFE